jgi:hypothetical protein
MFTTIILSLLVLLTLALSAYFWRSREHSLLQLREAERELSALRERAEILTAQQTSKIELSEAFKGIASSALESSMGQFLNLAQNSFQQASQLNKLDSEKRVLAMDALLKPVAENLER